jgi:hypothetical protein
MPGPSNLAKSSGFCSHESIRDPSRTGRYHLIDLYDFFVWAVLHRDSDNCV